jgi:hypothetical protein
MVGIPNAAAICIGPESLVIMRDDSANTPIKVSNDVLPVNIAADDFIRSRISSEIGRS